MAAAQAQAAAYAHDWPAALEHRMAAGQWAAAPELCVSTLAPQAFLAGRHAEVQAGAARFIAAQDEVERWEAGGHVYLEFYDLQAAAAAVGGAIPS